MTSSGASLGRYRRWLSDATLLVVGATAAATLLDPLDAGFATLWAGLVLVVVRSDLADYLIPDWASAAIAALGLVHAVAATSDDSGLPWPAIADAVSSGALAFAAFWLVARGFALGTGRDGLGFGDVKLAGALAIWLGAGEQIAALEIAALSAIAVVLVAGRRNGRRPALVPFGAFMAPAAWLAFVLGPAARRMLGDG